MAREKTLREVFDQVTMVAEIIPDHELGNIPSMPITSIAYGNETVPMSESEQVLQVMLSEHGGMQGAELAIILSALKALVVIHQTNHWQACHDSFYGDHLLFDKLYNAVVLEVDQIAERTIGIGSETLVNAAIQTKHQTMFQTMMGCQEGSLPNPNALVNLSLSAEMKFLMLVDAAVKYMKNFRGISRGTDNLIAGIQDVHEGHVYLLKQRAK